VSTNSTTRAYVCTVQVMTFCDTSSYTLRVYYYLSGPPLTYMFW